VFHYFAVDLFIRDPPVIAIEDALTFEYGALIKDIWVIDNPVSTIQTLIQGLICLKDREGKTYIAFATTVFTTAFYGLLEAIIGGGGGEL